MVLKALQPLPERRYGTAGQLGDEIDRLLGGHPVQAQSDTMAYRARRFAGRHRVGLIMAASLAALLLAFAIVASIQARAVGVERDRAQLEASRAQRVSELVTGIFALAEPAAGRGDSITARELLDQASRRIDLELRGDPATQAALYNALARVYGNLGLHDAAIVVLQRAQGLEAAPNSGDTLIRAETLHLLGERHASRNENAAAEALYRDALALRRRLNAPAIHVAATLDGLARVLGLADRFDEARALLEESVAIRRREPGPARVELVSGLYELGMLLHRRGEIERAEQLLREAVAVGEQISEPSPAKVTSLLVLAEVVGVFDGQPAKAEPLLREALSLARTMYAGDHQQVATCLFELARKLGDLDRLPEAEALARESAAMMQRLYGNLNSQTLLAVRTLGHVLVKQRRFGEAEAVLRSALTNERALFGEGHPSVLATSRSLASVIEAQRRYGEARRLREDDLARAIEVLGDHDVFVAIGLNGLGQNGLDSGRPDLAVTDFRRALAVRRQIHPADHWRIAEARGRIGTALLAAGRLAESEPDLVAAYEGLRIQRGTGADETERVRLRLLELYERLHRPDDARRYRVDDR